MPYHWPVFRSPVVKLVLADKVVKAADELWRTNFPSCFVWIHWRDLLLERNEVRWGITEKCLFKYLFFVPPVFSLLLTLFVSWNNELKWQLYVSLWHGQMTRTDYNQHEKTSSRWLWPYMYYQPMWQPTSQCSNNSVGVCLNSFMRSWQSYQSFQPWMMLLPKSCTLLSD